MSHYAVLVITNEAPTDELLAATLQPFHEYECTGIDDQYVVDVDVTEEVEADWQKPAKVVKLADGTIVSRWSETLYHPTGEKKYGRDKTEFRLPEGAEELEVPLCDSGGYESIEDYAEQYGNYVRRADGKFYRHTNPNAQWDWYQLGGRYGGKLRTLTKSGAERCGNAGVMGSTLDEIGVDIAQRKNLDFASMKRARVADRHDWIQDIMVKASVNDEQLNTALLAKPTLHEAWLALEPHPRGAEYTAWLAAQGRGGNLLAQINKTAWETPDLGSCPNIDAWVQAAPAFTCWSVLKDGVWSEKGKMGWWGMSVDTMTEEEWSTKVSELVENMPPDHWLSVVDCHI